MRRMRTHTARPLEDILAYAHRAFVIGRTRTYLCASLRQRNFHHARHGISVHSYTAKKTMGEIDPCAVIGGGAGESRIDVPYSDQEGHRRTTRRRLSRPFHIFGHVFSRLP